MCAPNFLFSKLFSKPFFLFSKQFSKLVNQYIVAQGVVGGNGVLLRSWQGKHFGRPCLADVV